MAKTREDAIIEHLYKYHRGQARAIEWADLLNDVIEKHSRNGYRATDAKWLAYSNALAKVVETHSFIKEDSQERIWFRGSNEE